MALVAKVVLPGNEKASEYQLPAKGRVRIKAPKGSKVYIYDTEKNQVVEGQVIKLDDDSLQISISSNGESYTVILEDADGSGVGLADKGISAENGLLQFTDGTSTVEFTATSGVGGTSSNYLGYLIGDQGISAGLLVGGLALLGGAGALLGGSGSEKDTTPPVVGPIDITTATDTGANDNITGNGLPVLTFTGEEGLTITLKGPGGVALAASQYSVTYANGTYTVTLLDAKTDVAGAQPFGTYNGGAATGNPAASADGTYTIVATDKAANSANVGTFIIDTGITAGPLDITTPTDTGANDNITANGLPVLTFTGEEGLTISLKGPDGTTLAASQYSVAYANGTYTVTLLDANTGTAGAQPFGTYAAGSATGNPASGADGTYSIMATDKAANTAKVGDFVIDTAVTTGPLDITTPTDTGANDNITGNGLPILTFTGEEGLTISLKGPDGTTLAASQYSVAYANGTYTVTLLDANTGAAGGQPFGTYNGGAATGNPASGADGTYSIMATDKAANSAKVGDFVIDTGVTAGPLDITTPTDTGANDNITGNGLPVLTFTGEEGLTISLKGPDGTTLAASQYSVAYANGTYTVTLLDAKTGTAGAQPFGTYNANAATGNPASSADGTYTIVATDKAANTANVGTFVIDTAVTTGPLDITTPTDTGANDNTTSNGLPVLTFTGEEGLTISLKGPDGTTLAASQYSVAYANGTYTVTLLDANTGTAGAQPFGTYNANAATGNPASSADGTYSIMATDKAANSAKVGDFVIDTAVTTGPLDITTPTDTGANDNITGNGLPVLTFTGEEGLTLSLKGPDGTTLAASQYSVAYANGTYTVTLLDAKTGTAGAQPFGTYNANAATGNPASSADGTYTIVATDKAANTADVGTFVIDTAVTTGPLDITTPTDTGPDDTTTGNGLPVLTFTGEEGLTISLKGPDGTTLAASQYSVAYANGTYTVTLLDAQTGTDGAQPFGTYNANAATGNPASSADGTYTIVATDKAANTANVGTFVIDTTVSIVGPSGGAGAADSTITINENTTPVFTFGSNESVTWSLAGGADASKFSIDPATGALRFVVAPDYEAPTDGNTDNAYLVKVKATDANGNVSTQTVTVNVADVDDTGPTLAGGQHLVYAENRAADTVVGTVVASDNVGVTGFRFTTTGTQTSADGYYTISNTGVVKITAAGVAAGVANNDHEIAPNSFTYGVQAGDAAGNWSADTSVNLAVTDLDESAPSVRADQTFAYPENRVANTVVGTVVASDNVGVTGFRFSATGTQTSADGFYAIDNSGVIRLTAAGVAAGVASNDYETLPNSFTYGVQAGDAAGNWSTPGNVTVNVTDLDDTAPSVAAQTFSYAENRSANAAVATVVATDAVGVAGFRFSATGTQTSADGFYTIDNSGVIRITAAGVAAGVANNDYETAPNSFTYGVQAGDTAGNWSAGSTITLNVTDLDDTAPTIAAQSFSYPENQLANSSVGTAVAADGTGVTAFRFSATGTSTSADGYYSIDNAGVIRITAAGVAAGRATNDYETLPNAFTYGVQAGDAAGNWSSASNVTLNVTDRDDTAPVIAAQTFSYAENRSANAAVATVVATDATGVTAYRFSANNSQTSADGYYTIDNAGVIKITASGVAAGVANNDYETLPNSFTYGVQAGDAAGNWSSASIVTLNVTNLDDTPPVVVAGQSLFYPENRVADATVGTVAATDGTGVTAFRFSATGTQTSADGYYTISNTGVVKITAAGVVAGLANNDFETLPNAFIHGVQAGDAAGNWSTATNVTLSVTNLDDTPPVVTAGQTFNYAENRVANTTVATVAATDNVGVTQFRFATSQTSTSTDGYYTISNTGVIKITAAGIAAGVANNDFETAPNSFTYAIQAGDAAGTWSAATNVVLNVTDVDDTGPTIAAQTFSYVENRTALATVATVAATDPSGVNGFRFAATGTATSADGYYTIDSTGAIKITATGAAAGVANNDFETLPNSFNYGVEARDTLGNWSSAATITLNVTNAEDIAPVVTASQSFNYAENKTAGASIGTVAATDNVAVTAFKFAATGTGTSADGYYQISSAGLITITANGVAAGVANNDYETAPNTFNYDVQAGDAAGNWSTPTTVTLNVTDVAEALTPLRVIYFNDYAYFRDDLGTDVAGQVDLQSQRPGAIPGAIFVQFSANVETGTSNTDGTKLAWDYDGGTAFTATFPLSSDLTGQSSGVPDSLLFVLNKGNSNLIQTTLEGNVAFAGATADTMDFAAGAAKTLVSLSPSVAANDIVIQYHWKMTDGGDTFIASSKDDWVVGGAGADTITGGGGADKLAGLGGNDTFTYTGVTDSYVNTSDALTNYDTVWNTYGDLFDFGATPISGGTAITTIANSGNAISGGNWSSITSDSDLLAALSGAFDNYSADAGVIVFENGATDKYFLVVDVDTPGSDTITSNDYVIEIMNFDTINQITLDLGRIYMGNNT